MLETKCVEDDFEMLVTVLAIFVTSILYLLTLVSGTNIQKRSPISKFCHQHPKIVTNIKSPTSTCHQHLWSRTHCRTHCLVAFWLYKNRLQYDKNADWWIFSWDYVTCHSGVLALRFGKLNTRPNINSDFTFSKRSRYSNLPFPSLPRIFSLTSIIFIIFLEGYWQCFFGNSSL